MEISEVCNRCGRTKKLESDTDTLMSKLKEQKDMKEGVEALKHFVSILDKPLPTVAIITSDKTVRVIEHLCSEPHGKYQGCVQRVATLISDLFGKGI